MQITSGSAIVNGIPYQSDATVNLTVGTPVVSTTGKLVVLHADYTAQTVRLLILSSADGTLTIPSVTQNASIWEIPLWSFLINTSGTISTYKDLRKFISSNSAISFISYNGSTVSSGSEINVTHGNIIWPNGSTTITFPTPYTNIPTVVLTPIGGANVTITSISATQFIVNNATGSSVTGAYIAIGFY